MESIQADGFTVSSSEETADSMRANLGVKEEPAQEAGRAQGEAIEARPDADAADEDSKSQEAAGERERDPDTGQFKPKEERDNSREAVEKRKRDARSRVEDATRKLAQERREKESIRAHAAQLEAELAEARAARAPRETPKDAAPSRDQFATDEEYLDAALEYRDGKRQHERLSRERSEAQERDFQKRATTFAAAYKKAAADPEFIEAIGDWVDVKPITMLEKGESRSFRNVIAETIFRAGDTAPALLRYFAEHDDEVDRLSELSPDAYLRAVGKIEAKLESTEGAAPTERPAPKVEVSSAKPPVRPVTGSANAVPADDLPEDASLDDHIRVMNRLEKRTSARR